MKIKAETQASAQHNARGIVSIISLERAGMIEIKEVSLAGFDALMRGCAFDNFSGGGAGFGTAVGSIRAVFSLGLAA
jgi:hypothetical protein